MVHNQDHLFNMYVFRLSVWLRLIEKGTIFYLSAPDFRTALGTARYSRQVWGAVNPTVGVCEWNPQNISEISTILNIQKQDFPNYHGG